MTALAASPWRRYALPLGIVALLIALVSTVGLASTRGVDSERRPLYEPGQNVGDYVYTAILIFELCAIVLAAVMLWRFIRNNRFDPERSSFRIKEMLFVFAVLGAVGYLAISQMDPKSAKERLAQQQQQEERARARTKPKPPPPAGTRRPEFEWALALGLGGLVVFGGAIYAMRRRGRVRSALDLDPPELLSVAGALSAAIDESLGDLRREPDPRRAVIAAYARMERVLAIRGVPRRRSEAPFEYLRRMLAELRVSPAPALTLTELFERAKFSSHRVDPAMKAEAIEALEEVRDELDRDPTPLLRAEAG